MNEGARRGRAWTTFADLAADLKTARQTGVAVDLEEHSSGVCATGVALRDPAGNYVAISVPVPSQRFKAEYKTIARRLLETKGVLEGRIISQNL